jgi:mRNA interferase RelE/StbE
MPRNQRDLIQSKIEEYALNPDHLKNNVIKLADRPGYRMRVGDWRVIFEVSDTDMDVIVIGPRGSVYD